MTVKKTNKEDVNFEEIRKVPFKEKKVEIKKLTIRQFFYGKKKYDENLIKSLERSYKEETKSIEEWVKIMSFKGIIF